ncbi:hypothetical protein C8R46DRAFT_996159 [Mycena filopes]|nr:hypothetical protein C8R46DRAFT_996159 [Mycena filopes]
MTPTHCANCGNPASSRCSGCLDAPEYKSGDAPGVVYCSPKCQTSHWPTHKTQCHNLRARRRLLRVATILRASLLVQREAEFDMPLVKIELKNGVLHLYRDPSPDVSPRPFDNRLTGNVAHKEAALTHNQCTMAFALLGPLTRKLLAGIASPIETLDLQIGKPVLPTKLVERNPEDDWGGGPHTVQQVGLGGGTERWIIDTAGCQYGFREVLVTFERYVTEKECTEVTPPGPYTASETTDLDAMGAYYAKHLAPFAWRVMKKIHDQQREVRVRFANFVSERVGDGKEFFGTPKELDGSADDFRRRFERLMKELKRHMESKGRK